MGGVCSTHGRYEEYILFLSDALKRTEHLGDLYLDGRIVLKHRQKTRSSWKN
jgi:hypothetical protein